MLYYKVDDINIPPSVFGELFKMGNYPKLECITLVSSKKSESAVEDNSCDAVTKEELTPHATTQEESTIPSTTQEESAPHCTQEESGSKEKDNEEFKLINQIEKHTMKILAMNCVVETATYESETRTRYLVRFNCSEKNRIENIPRPTFSNCTLVYNGFSLKYHFKAASYDDLLLDIAKVD